MSISTVINNNNTFYNFSVTSHLPLTLLSIICPWMPQCKTRRRTQACALPRHSAQNIYLTSRV